jgi:predicted nucleic acid-binding protein
MTRYVIGPDVALGLARDRLSVSPGDRLLAPTLLRSEVLSSVYQEMRRGAISQQEAEFRLDHIRALRLRLLGDRVLQNLAWRLAERLGWADTFTAEYLALTQLQADAFITLDPALARAVEGVVATAPAQALGL